jgi:hypothetical protein
MGYLGFASVWELFSQDESVSGIFTGRLRFLPPLLAQRVVTMVSIISPATKPSTAPRRVAQNQPQLKVIPGSSIFVHLLCHKAKVKKNVKLHAPAYPGRGGIGRSSSGQTIWFNL